MTAILSKLFRGLASIVIAVLVVTVTWSTYIYRDPIARTMEPVTNLFRSDSNDPARAGAVVPVNPEPVAPPAANNTPAPDSSDGVKSN